MRYSGMNSKAMILVIALCIFGLLGFTASLV